MPLPVIWESTLTLKFMDDFNFRANSSSINGFQFKLSKIFGLKRVKKLAFKIKICYDFKLNVSKTYTELLVVINY